MSCFLGFLADNLIVHVHDDNVFGIHVVHLLLGRGIGKYMRPRESEDSTDNSCILQA
jgi:hypothetical protein